MNPNYEKLRDIDNAIRAHYDRMRDPPRQFVIGDVEPREPEWTGNWPNPPTLCDPMALDYVVGDGPREPVWREKSPLWAPIDRKARDAHYAGYGVVGMRWPPVAIDPRFP